MVDGSKPTNLEELMPEVENRIDAVHRIVGWIRAHSYIIRRVRRIGWRGAGVQPGGWAYINPNFIPFYT